MLTLILQPEGQSTITLGKIIESEPDTKEEEPIKEPEKASSEPKDDEEPVEEVIVSPTHFKLTS